MQFIQIIKEIRDLICKENRARECEEEKKEEMLVVWKLRKRN